VTDLTALIADGAILGWSVAWPPGPINAEMVRRGLAQGFRPAFGVGLGACSGDALWAIAVLLGTGFAIGADARSALAWLSTALLMLLAAFFLHGAWRGWRALGQGAATGETRRAPSQRNAYLLGLGMALTSPWNMAFWVAVMGRAEIQLRGIASALLVAGSVILGAGLWCVALCTATARLRVSFGGPVWQIVAMGLTGLLMLGFAARGLWNFAAA
jgi:threonine/homoserine/homoserine lactone efflux protein